jgi:hypothetical protein
MWEPCCIPAPLVAVTRIYVSYILLASHLTFSFDPSIFALVFSSLALVQKLVRTLHDRLKIIEELREESWGETCGYCKMTRVARYAHSVTDAGCEHILGLEKLYFQLRQKSANKQKTMYDFFCLKKWFSGFTVFPHSSIIFSTPLKNGRSKEHCIYTHTHTYIHPPLPCHHVHIDF